MTAARAVPPPRRSARLRRLAGIAGAAALVLLVCGGALDAQNTAAGAAPAQPRAAQGNGFIWKFDRNGRTGWLVGSLHLATPDFYPLPAPVEQAFGRADTLVEEIDLDQAATPQLAALVLSKGMYPAGTTLSSQLSKDTYASVNEFLAKAGLGIAAFQQMKPWMVSITIETIALQQLGFDPAHGIDKHFRDAATAAGKRFVALETAEEQIGFLDGLSPGTQDAMLKESVEGIQAEQTEIRALARAWRAGDAATVERIALKGLSESPEVYNALLRDRNRRWVPQIESCVQTRACFVVVGAAHLVGPEGLVALLKARGYAVEQL